MAKKCKYEKALRTLVQQNQEFMRWMDAEMVKPSDVSRGRRIAKALNALGMAVDNVRYFTLGVDYRRDKNATFSGKTVKGNVQPMASGQPEFMALSRRAIAER